MRKLLSSVAIALVLAPVASAQAACSKLAVKGGAAGKQMDVSVSGATKNALTFLMIGQTAGSTSIKLGSLGTLSVGLDQPFVPFPVGRTDANGDLDLSFTVPASATKTDLHAQAISMGIKFMPLSLSFCESNVIKATVGS